jgi:hypothetical protein
LVCLIKKKTLRVFENRMLGKIFVAKREEVTGWRELHIEGLHDFLLLSNITRAIK